MIFSNRILKILLSLLLFLDISLLLFIRYERIENQNLIRPLLQENDSLKQIQKYKNIWLLNFSLMCEFQSDMIDSNIILQDENNKGLQIRQLGINGPKLVFKFSSSNCETCVDEQIVLLKKASEFIGAKNIILFSDFNTPRELSQFVRINQIGFKTYFLANFNLTKMDHNLPYYFILDSSFSLKQFFIPVRGDYLLTQQYFKNINGKYFH